MYRDKWHLQNITNVFSYCTAISNSKDLKHIICVCHLTKAVCQKRSRDQLFTNVDIK